MRLLDEFIRRNCCDFRLLERDNRMPVTNQRLLDGCINISMKYESHSAMLWTRPRVGNYDPVR